MERPIKRYLIHSFQITLSSFNVEIIQGREADIFEIQLKLIMFLLFCNSFAVPAKMCQYNNIQNTY